MAPKGLAKNGGGKGDGAGNRAATGQQQNLRKPTADKKEVPKRAAAAAADAGRGGDGPGPYAGRDAKRQKVEAAALQGKRQKPLLQQACGRGGTTGGGGAAEDAGAAAAAAAAAAAEAVKAAAAAAKGAAATAAGAAAKAVAAVDDATAAVGAAKPPNRAALNSNWDALKAAVAATKKPPPPEFVQRRRKAAAAAGGGDAARRPAVIGSETGPTRVLALDCEMVGTGPRGVNSVLARVCVVNSAGAVVMDTFVMPKAKVTDYRTWVSGVRPCDVANGRPHDEVVKEVRDLVKDRILVGHAIGNDLRALELEAHPLQLLRDTSKYPSLMKVLPTGKKVSASLKDLASSHLGLTIQEGEHTPVDDARAALYLYQKYSREWEAAVRSGKVTPVSGLGKKSAGGKAAAKGRPLVKGVAKTRDKGLHGVQAGGVQAKKRNARNASGGSAAGNEWRQRRHERKASKGSGSAGPALLWSLENDPYADL